MKILVVDDNPRKYQLLLKVLNDAGIERDSVVFSASAQAARSALVNAAFDLMVLDILIPLRETEDPHHQHSLDLLNEIVVSDEYHRPFQIIGITADSEAAELASPSFSEHLWTVIQYDERSDEWASQIKNCVVYVQGKISQPAEISYGLDILVVCALPDPELRQVLALPWSFGAARPVDEYLFVHDGTLTSDGKTLTVAAAACPRMGMVSAALTTARAIKALRPRIVVMTGICAGIPSKVSLGDVIFADPVWDWQRGKYLREVDAPPQFLIGPHQAGPLPVARAFAEQLKADKKLLSEIALAAPDDPPAPLRLHLGPVASGSAVVADSVVTTEIGRQNRDAVGVEMECYGFFCAAEDASSPRPLAVAFKAVCDFADALKNDKHQRYASFVSATVMKEYMERFAKRLVQAN